MVICKDCVGVWPEYLWFGIKDFSFKQRVCGCMQALCGCVQDCDMRLGVDVAVLQALCGYVA